MTKKQFLKKYLSLSQDDKNAAKTYYSDMLSGALFPKTFETAEKCLLWIKEAEASN